MSIEQLRNFLIDKISGIRDEDYLMALKTILNCYSGPVEPYKLTGVQREEVLAGIEQAKNGQVISNEDLEKEEDEWLAE